MQAAILTIPTERRRWFRRAWVRGALGMVALLVVLQAGYAVVWRLRHPAPLGRSPEAVDRTLARDLPAGTSVAGVTAYLRRYELEFSVDSAGGRRTVLAAARDVDAGVFVTESVGIELEFDAKWRLASRRTRAWSTGP